MSASRILVVDDEIDISTVLTVTLRRAGFEVRTANDGLEAIEAIQAEAPDLVILDVMMPRLDGLETLKRIREHGPTTHIPVIMLSAKTQLADKVRRVARALAELGVQPRDRVTLQLPNWHECLTVHFALERLGGSPRWRSRG